MKLVQNQARARNTRKYRCATALFAFLAVSSAALAAACFADFAAAFSISTFDSDSIPKSPESTTPPSLYLPMRREELLGVSVSLFGLERHEELLGLSGSLVGLVRSSAAVAAAAGLRRWVGDAGPGLFGVAGRLVLLKSRLSNCE